MCLLVAASCVCYLVASFVLPSFFVYEKDKKRRVAGRACLWLRLVFATLLLRFFCLLFCLVLVRPALVVSFVSCLFHVGSFLRVCVSIFLNVGSFRFGRFSRIYVCFALVRFFTFVYRYSLTLVRFALVGFLAFCCAFVYFDVRLLLSRWMFFFFSWPLRICSLVRFAFVFLEFV